MLFPDANLARCIKEDRLRDTLRDAEKARWIREAGHANGARPDTFSRLVASVRDMLLPPVHPATRNRTPVKKGTSLRSL